MLTDTILAPAPLATSPLIPPVGTHVIVGSLLVLVILAWLFLAGRAK
jgi:hypothetical protein